MRADRLRPARATTIERSITILRPREEVFRVFRRLHGLAELIPRSSCAEIVDEELGKWLRWRSRGAAGLRHAGAVQLCDAPGHQGVEARVLMTYQSPYVWAQPLVRVAARLLAWRLETALHRVQQALEAGELARAS